MVRLLPEPDSPTTPSDSPALIAMLIPSTARPVAAGEGNATDRFSISSRAMSCLFTSPLRVRGCGAYCLAVSPHLIAQARSHLSPPGGGEGRASTSVIRAYRKSDLALQLGIEGIPQAVAEKVEGQHRDQDHDARKRHHPPGARHEFTGVGQHRTPFGQGRLGPKPEETERRCVQNGGLKPPRPSGRPGPPP